MNASNTGSTPPSIDTKPPVPPVPQPSEKPVDSRLSPETEAFITQMLDNLNTHQPGVPRGHNTRNWPAAGVHPGVVSQEQATPPPSSTPPTYLAAAGFQGKTKRPARHRSLWRPGQHRQHRSGQARSARTDLPAARCGHRRAGEPNHRRRSPARARARQRSRQELRGRTPEWQMRSPDPARRRSAKKKFSAG